MSVLVLGLLVAFVPGLVAGDRFMCVMEVWSTGPWDHRPPPSEWIEIDGSGSVSDPDRFVLVQGTSAIDLASSDSTSTIVAATLALAPALFVWWRRAGFAFARAAGLACAVVATAAVVVLVASMRGLSDLPEGVWWTVPVGGVLMAAAFVVAPAVRVRDE